ncbi:MAG: DUF2059 domain-containing protein [Pseudomonadota bacterium]
MPFANTVRLLAASSLFALAANNPASAQAAFESETLGIPESELGAETSETATSPEAMTVATEIVDLGYPEAEREALFFATMDQMVGQMRIAIAPTLPQDDPGAVAILDDWITEYTAESKEVLRKHIPSIMAGMTSAYAKIFTLQELNDILAFVQTPSGKRFFALSPAVVGEPSFADANQAYMDESMEMLAPAQTELIGRIMEYLENKETMESTSQT